MEKKFICIVCPIGCELTTETDEEGNLQSVAGNRCGRGKKYAVQESKMPMRMLTSTVKIRHGRYSRIPVISSESIPKDKIFEVMEAIHQAEISAPVQLRDVIIPNVCGLSADIVASRSMSRIDGIE